jgi:hypothetical protein
MDTERVLSELTQYEGLPVDAIRAAAADRAAVLPRLLEAFDNYTPGITATEDLLLLAFHLLGEWRETSAYRPLTRFLRRPRGDVAAVLGDCITETSHRVMAAVFDGDAQPLCDMILDSAADEFVRSRMCEVVAMVTLRGDMPREEAGRFLHACFTELKPQQDCFAWNGWQSAIAMLGLHEMKPLVREAFDRESIAPGWMEFKHFEEDLAWTLEHPGEPPPHPDGEYSLWSDTVGEMSTWAGFSKDNPERRKRQENEPARSTWLAQPAVNTYRDVGRNDPCPCGSGKKFKKCCLANAA